MKIRIYILLVTMLLTSCEEVIDVELPSDEMKLTFDAILRYNEDDPQENRISVATAGSFFNEIQPDTLRRIQTQNLASGGVGFYTRDPDVFGDYVPGTDEGGPYADTTFVSGPGDSNDDIFLSFIYLDEIYGAYTNFIPVTDLISVMQGDNSFLDDETEIIATFSDPEDEDNFYVFGYGNGEYTAFDDQFFNGQEYSFSYFSNQSLSPGDELTIQMWGVDEDFYVYMVKLIEQSELGENSLFQVPVSTVRGNILKLEGIDNIDTFNNVGRPQEFILGYFAFVQERTKTLVIQ